MYYNNPKEDAKSSFDSEKANKEYGLRQFYAQICGRVFRGDTEWPILKDCLRHNEKGLCCEQTTI